MLLLPEYMLVHYGPALIAAASLLCAISTLAVMGKLHPPQEDQEAHHGLPELLGEHRVCFPFILLESDQQALQDALQPCLAEVRTVLALHMSALAPPPEPKDVSSSPDSVEKCAY